MSISRTSLLSKIDDFFLCGRIFALICSLPFLFRLMNIQSILKVLTPKNIKSPITPDKEKKIIQWTDAVLGWEFFVFRKSCLKRSLVLFHFLKKSGLPIQINFGVRKLAQNPEHTWPLLDGHGWLSLGGRTYSEKGEPQSKFKLIYSFPPLPQGG